MEQIYRTDSLRSEELRIVLVGKTGVGKSASGNTILGREEFESEITPTSPTPKCEEGRANVKGQNVHVIDTRGLLDTNHSPREIKPVIEECINLSCPGPHVFLLVIQLGRFTQEEQNTVKLIKEIFGEESAKYTMVLFSNGARLKKLTIEEFMYQNKVLKDFISQCQGGYHVFENNKPVNHSQVTELLQKIEKMVAVKVGGYYTTEMWREELEKWFKNSDYYTPGQSGMPAKSGRFRRQYRIVGAVGGAIGTAIVGFRIIGLMGGVVGTVAGVVVGWLMGGTVGPALAAVMEAAIRAIVRCLNGDRAP